MLDDQERRILSALEQLGVSSVTKLRVNDPNIISGCTPVLNALKRCGLVYRVGSTTHLWAISQSGLAAIQEDSA